MWGYSPWERSFWEGPPSKGELEIRDRMLGFTEGKRKKKDEIRLSQLEARIEKLESQLYRREK